MKITIEKPESYGPYLLPLVYRDKDTKILHWLVFSHEEDRRKAMELYAGNGHEVVSCSELAVDRCRTVEYQPKNEEMVAEMPDSEVLRYFGSGELDQVFGKDWTMRDARNQLIEDLDAGDKEINQ